MTGPRLRVSISAEHDIVASGLRALLASADDVEIVDEASSRETVPDVILYDAAGVGSDDGAELLALIAQSESAVLVMRRDLRPDLAARALERGAAGFFSIESDRDSVLTMVRRAASGALVGARSDVLTDVLGAAAGLSAREVEVLSRITKGASNQEIAESLSLSGNTVKSYVRSAYRKIEVTNRAQAVAWCLTHGFEPPAT